MTKKILRRKEVLRMLGVAESTLWRWEMAGFFPAAVIRRPHFTAYNRDEVMGFISDNQKKLNEHRATNANVRSPSAPEQPEPASKEIDYSTSPPVRLKTEDEKLKSFMDELIETRKRRGSEPPDIQFLAKIEGMLKLPLDRLTDLRIEAECERQGIPREELIVNAVSYYLDDCDRARLGHVSSAEANYKRSLMKSQTGYDPMVNGHAD